MLAQKKQDLLPKRPVSMGSRFFLIHKVRLAPLANAMRTTRLFSPEVLSLGESTSALRPNNSRLLVHAHMYSKQISPNVASKLQARLLSLIHLSWIEVLLSALDFHYQ